MTTITAVPSDLPTVVFLDIDDERLTVRPVNDDEAYYTQITVGDQEVWLSARDTLALSKTLDATAIAVGAASAIAGAPLFSALDDSRPAFTLE